MGTLSRLAGLGALVGRSTSRYVQGRVRDALGGEAPADDTLEQVRSVVRDLSRLKGAAMKAGQQLALLAVHLDLPDDIRQVLGTLHAKAEPIPYATVRRQIETSLGTRLSDTFASFTEVPLGTASLAQAA